MPLYKEAYIFLENDEKKMNGTVWETVIHEQSFGIGTCF